MALFLAQYPNVLFQDIKKRVISFPSETPVPTGTQGKIWTGSAWETHPIKVFMGGSWQQATIKRHNGSTWESI